MDLGHTEQRDLTEEEIQEFLHGQPQSQLSETSESSSPGFGSVSENDTANHSSCYNSNVDVSVLPLHPQFIIPEEALTIEKTAKLGEGHFGIVYRGRVNTEAVAVKSTKEYADVSCVKAFMEEIKIMAYIAQEREGAQLGNENIVNFIGVVIDRLRERLVYAVVELSPIGNLHSYLETIRERRTPEYNNLLVNDRFITYVSAGLKTPFAFTQYQPNIITTMDLVHWCSQIASGMNYLASKRVIHGDLATRNVLVFPHNVVKITDFGLSKKMYAYSQYVRNKDKKVALPWAWMALECLKHNTFSTESDIWSFGVTMWEIFSMGQLPYPGYNFSNNFVSALSSGMRMGKPTNASSTIYNQMWNCWNSSSKNRPSFAQLRDFFKDILQDWVADAEINQKEQINTIHLKHEIPVFIHKHYV